VHYLEEIIEKLRSLNDRGSRTAVNGTRFISKLEPLPDGTLSDAHLHVFYAPLNDQQIDQLGEKISRRIPDELRDVLLRANGFSLFGGSLSMSGLRFNYSRSLEDEVQQPVSMEYGNTKERPIEGEAGKERYADNSSEIRFGFYSKDPGAKLMMKVDGDRRIFAVPRFHAGPILFEWPDMQTMLRSEVDRMAKLYLTIRSDVNRFRPMPAPWQ